MISLPDSCYTFLASVLHVESVCGVSMIIFIIVALYIANYGFASILTSSNEDCAAVRWVSRWLNGI